VKWRTRIHVGIIHAVLATSLPAQKETFAPANDVSFSISTERHSYKAGEQFTLNYRVTNISNKPLYVPREWEVTCPAGPNHDAKQRENRSPSTHPSPLAIPTTKTLSASNKLTRPERGHARSRLFVNNIKDER
jgi:hypothetical protein